VCVRERLSVVGRVADRFAALRSAPSSLSDKSRASRKHESHHAILVASRTARRVYERLRRHRAEGRQQLSRNCLVAAAKTERSVWLRRVTCDARPCIRRRLARARLRTYDRNEFILEIGFV